MTATIAQRSLTDVFIGEPLHIIKDQPHQALLSTGSVTIMAQFAASGGIVEPWVGYCIAVGVEWAYLRGLASDTRAQSAWGDALSYSAFAIVVLWGVLWCAKLFGAFEYTTGAAGWLLAIAHIAPIAWLSLCSAMCHRAALAADEKERKAHAIALEAERVARIQAEQERLRKLQEEEDAILLEDKRKRAELARWEEAQKIKANFTTVMPKKLGIVPLAEGTMACPKCAETVNYSNASEAGTIKRWGCPECRAKRKEGRA